MKFKVTYNHLKRDKTFPDLNSLMFAFECSILESPAPGEFIVSYSDTAAHLNDILTRYVRDKGEVAVAEFQ